MKVAKNYFATIIIFSLVLAFGFSGIVLASNWPEKTITIIYHSKAGSGGDMFLRALAKVMEKDLGQSIIVDNRPGAAGMNAWKVAKDARDGNTFLGVSSTLITSPIMNNMHITYNDFKPVTMMFVDPMVFFVSKDKPWNTLEDFINDAKKNPGKYNIAGGIPGELGYVAAKLLMEQSGAKFNIVPFESGVDSNVSVLGGHIDGAIGEYGEALAQIENGDFKVIIAFNKIEGTDYRTVQDAGYDFTVEKFRGLLAPKYTSQEAIEKFVAAAQKAMNDPEFKAYYQNMKLVPTFKPQAEFTKVMANQDMQIRKEVN